MKKLSSELISKYNSTYISEGRKKESWNLDNVEIDDNAINADVSMSSIYISPSDKTGFHLSIFTALEFVSQLIIIYFHIWAELAEKTQEAWMIESTISYKKAIRCSSNIKVRIKVCNIKKVGKKLYAVVNFDITDHLGGKFVGKIKAFIA